MVKTLQASPDEATRNQAIQTFLQSVRLQVFDMERQQYVDEKDFINKNFAGG
ncbi:MAG TPA: hypothetical protein VFM39_03905 [bacterium]|nr:hypothetical protein [bacterium]